MMYDDIAYDESNPKPGKIYNHPYGRNVYKGVPKDYIGDMVTPENFLDVLQGIEAYLGDEYSIHWMEDSDSIGPLRRISLGDQFEFVAQQTERSSVTMYGDDRMENAPLSDFQGDKKARPIIVPKVPCRRTSNRDVPVAILTLELESTTDPVRRIILEKKLKKTMDNREFVDKKVAELAMFIAGGNEDIAKSLLSSERKVKNFECYEDAVLYFNVKCFDLSSNPYVLEHLRIFVNACEFGYMVEDITHAMDAICSHPSINGTV
ncbi:hypothetical protein V5799_021373 [Amblyomma americanum]|uniref:Legumain prodomain domain-containing protein n=1 Tax=Amblyomma americanum TaxID=6943 RepID=A0AAQ4FRH6_AMBAM